MSLSMAILTFLNAWWISLFFVLPFTPRAFSENGSVKIIPWKKIFIRTTLCAVVATFGLFLMVISDLVPARDVIE